MLVRQRQIRISSQQTLPALASRGPLHLFTHGVCYRQSRLEERYSQVRYVGSRSSGFSRISVTGCLHLQRTCPSKLRRRRRRRIRSLLRRRKRRSMPLLKSDLVGQRGLVVPITRQNEVRSIPFIYCCGLNAELLSFQSFQSACRRVHFRGDQCFPHVL